MIVRRAGDDGAGFQSAVPEPLTLRLLPRTVSF
jgi:hypothetical protein